MDNTKASPGWPLRVLSILLGTVSFLGTLLTGLYLLLIWMNVRMADSRHVMIVTTCWISIVAGVLVSYRLITRPSAWGLLWFAVAAGMFFAGMECQSWLGATGLIH